MNIDESLALRAAHTSEAGVIASMSRLLIEHGLKWRWTTARIKRSIIDKDTMVLVASVEGILSGFAIMKFRDDESHLFLLAVAPALPAFRHRFRVAGLAGQIMPDCRDQ